MRDAIVSWDLPTTRVQGGALDVADIAAVYVSLSGDGGANFSAETSVAPPDTSLPLNAVPFGSWVVRCVVETTDGQRSGDVDTAFDVVDDSAPDIVQNVQVQLT